MNYTHILVPIDEMKQLRLELHNLGKEGSEPDGIEVDLSEEGIRDKAEEMFEASVLQNVTISATAAYQQCAKDLLNNTL